MMAVWALIGGLASLTVLVLWVKWLLTPSSSTWHQGYLRSTLMYGVPGFFLTLSIVLLASFAENIGVSEELITAIAGFPSLLCVALGLLVILVYAGVPAPPFCVPKWIRLQDKERRMQRKSAQTAASRLAKREKARQKGN